jgi:hypothetical protein
VLPTPLAETAAIAAATNIRIATLKQNTPTDSIYSSTTTSAARTRVPPLTDPQRMPVMVSVTN